MQHVPYRSRTRTRTRRRPRFERGRLFVRLRQFPLRFVFQGEFFYRKQVIPGVVYWGHAGSSLRVTHTSDRIPKVRDLRRILMHGERFSSCHEAFAVVGRGRGHRAAVRRRGGGQRLELILEVWAGRHRGWGSVGMASELGVGCY